MFFFTHPTGWVLKKKGYIIANDDLLLEKTLSFHNVATFTESVFNKNWNNYHHNLFLEKCFYQSAKK